LKTIGTTTKGDFIEQQSYGIIQEKKVNEVRRAWVKKRKLGQASSVT